jgi:hypothetical protein
VALVVSADLAVFQGFQGSLAFQGIQGRVDSRVRVAFLGSAATQASQAFLASQESRDSAANLAFQA